MYYHRAVISYKGSGYFGWQDLGVSEEKPTVQAAIQQVLKKICKYTYDQGLSQSKLSIKDLFHKSGLDLVD